MWLQIDFPTLQSWHVDAVAWTVGSPFVFANQRGNRIKVLVHDGVGIWLAARRLHQGKFIWVDKDTANCQLEHIQLDALVLGLPWQRMGSAGAITVV